MSTFESSRKMKPMEQMCFDMGYQKGLDDAVKHGSWTELDASYWRWRPDGAHPIHAVKFRHDACGEIIRSKKPYCPGCGTKMDGGSN